MNVLWDIVMVMVGGGIGALLRYGVSSFVHLYMNKDFAWGTLTVNLVGAVLIGALWELTKHIEMPSQIRLFIFVGFLGGFTTFSSYALECFEHFQADGSKVALLYMAASNVLGVLLVFGAVFATRYLDSYFRTPGS